MADDASFAASDIPAALGLLTRIPVPGSDRGARSAWAWPLAGLAVALVAGVAGWLALKLGCGAGVSAALALATAALATGAMHEDGLADCADGFFGGWTVARRLEIMKDSAVGSYAVLALVWTSLARWAALAALIPGHGIFAPLIAAAVLSRAVLPLAMLGLPNARGAGLSAATGVPPRASAATGLGIALVLAALCAGWAVIPAVVLGGLAALAVAGLALVKIGGQTGDVLGAMQQLTELAVLAVLLAA